MIRKTIEKIQKSQKRRYLPDFSNSTAHDADLEVEQAETDAMTTSADSFEQSTLNEAELSTVTFERGKTNMGAVCLWFNGYRYTHQGKNRWRCSNRSCPANATTTNNNEVTATGTLGQKEHNHLPVPHTQQKSQKRRYLPDFSNSTAHDADLEVEQAETDAMTTSADSFEQSTLNEAELSTVTFECGKTNRGRVCLWLNGYRYTHHKGNHWRCSNHGCPASATTTSNNEVTATGTLVQREHNHLPVPHIQQAESRRQKIKESVRAEPGLKPTLLLAQVRRTATDETFVAMRSDNALLGMMRREKKKLLGNVDLQDPLSFVIPPALREQRGEDVVLYDSRTVRRGEKDVVLIFGAGKTLDILRQNGTWHLDSTLKCSPTMWEQCVVVGASVQNRMCIGVWSLLPGKHQRYYEEVLAFLHEQIAPTSPREVICDIENAEMVAVNAIFPNAEMKCCMFHFGHSLYGAMKRLGLVPMYGENSVRGEATRNTFRRVLSLPLLPSSVVKRAFNIIVDSAPIGMEHFFLYFASTYIGLTQRQMMDGANAFTANPNLFSSVFVTSTSTTMEQQGFSLEDPFIRRAEFPIPFWNMHTHAASAIARINNGLEATHLHFMKGLGQHPTLSDFVCKVNENIDRQVDAARSARNFVHKRKKRNILQEAIIMRILADASYNSDREIHDLMTALGLQVEEFAGKLKDVKNL